MQFAPGAANPVETGTQGLSVEAFISCKPAYIVTMLYCQTQCYMSNIVTQLYIMLFNM